MNKKTAIIAAWLIGNLGFQVALLCSAFGMKGFAQVIEGVITNQVYIIYLMEFVFIGIGCYITFRHGTNETWIKLLIGYAIGYMLAQVILGLLSIAFHAQIPNGLAVFTPYAAGILIAVISFLRINEHQTILRYTFFGLAGTLTILIYDAVIKFWPSEWASMLQFIVFVPILYVWIPIKKKTEDDKKDA